jgi:DNA invertase Pin-like site-specific DNA recombinase
MTFRTDGPAPLVFIYDRHATANKVILQLRLEACAQYAEARGWEIGGWFLDTGDDALTDHRRPSFEAMLNTCRSADAEIPRVVLVHDWDRLTRDGWQRRIFARRVTLAGGWVETIAGESTKDDQRGRLTSAPITS